MKYPKINSVFQRGDKGQFIEGSFAAPEFDYLADLPWVGYEKYDGTNTRLYSGGPLGRTDRSQWNDEVFNEVEETWKRAYGADVFTDDGIVTLYGETIGPKLQGNPHQVDEHMFILFDAQLASGRWLEDHELSVIADLIGVHQAVMVDTMTLTEWVEHMQRRHPGYDQGFLFPKAPGEGFILRPEVPLLDMYGHRIQTKLKWRDFA